MDVLELKTTKTAEEIKAEADEYLGLVDIQLPFTPKGWTTANDAGYSQDCTVTAAGGEVFSGTVNDTNPARCTITVELR